MEWQSGDAHDKAGQMTGHSSGVLQRSLETGPHRARLHALWTIERLRCTPSAAPEMMNPCSTLILTGVPSSPRFCCLPCSPGQREGVWVVTGLVWSGLALCRLGYGYSGLSMSWSILCYQSRRRQAVEPLGIKTSQDLREPILYYSKKAPSGPLHQVSFRALSQRHLPGARSASATPASSRALSLLRVGGLSGPMLS